MNCIAGCARFAWARGRKRPIPNPVSFFSVRVGPCRSLLIGSITKFVDKSGAALSPRRATHLSLASPRESKRREGDPGACVPPLRYGQPAVLGPAGVELELASLKQSLALFRLDLRSSAHSQGLRKSRYELSKNIPYVVHLKNVLKSPSAFWISIAFIVKIRGEFSNGLKQPEG